MKGQALETSKGKKRKQAQPAKIKKSKEIQQKELAEDTQRLPGAQDPRGMQHSWDEMEKVQKEAQEMKDKYVLLNSPMLQKRLRKLGTNNL